jgi:hypothetical protein
MIIGIGSKARQGKDSAAEAIVQHFSLQRNKKLLDGEWLEATHAKVFKWADALYKVCREEYGMIGKDAPLLQKVGNDRRLEFGMDYWINQIAVEILNFRGIAVVADTRYINEADWIKEHHGYNIQVTRVNEDGTNYIADDRDPNFISEVQLDGYNFDAYIKSKSPELTGILAVKTVEYLRFK